MTPGLSKFESGLIDHLKNLKDGLKSKELGTNKLVEALNNKIKSNFEVDNKTKK